MKRRRCDRTQAVLAAIEHVSKPIVIFRHDTVLFSILLASNLEQFGVELDPEGAWLSLVDAYAEYTWIKEGAMKSKPVICDTISVSLVETPIEEVFTTEYLDDLEKKGWLPAYLVEKRHKGGQT